jgi:hypothetical protein
MDPPAVGEFTCPGFRTAGPSLGEAERKSYKHERKPEMEKGSYPRLIFAPLVSFTVPGRFIFYLW